MEIIVQYAHETTIISICLALFSPIFCALWRMLHCCWCNSSHVAKLTSINHRWQFRGIFLRQFPTRVTRTWGCSGRGNYRRFQRPNECQCDAMHHAWMTSSYRTCLTLITPPASSSSRHTAAAAAAAAWRSCFITAVYTPVTREDQTEMMQTRSFLTGSDISVCLSVCQFNELWVNSSQYCSFSRRLLPAVSISKNWHADMVW